MTGDGPVNTVAPTISGTAQRAVDADRDAGHVERQRQHLRLPVAALGDGPGGHRGRDRRQLRARRSPTSARRCACSSPPPTPTAARSRASAATATVQAAPPVNTGLPVVTGAAAAQHHAERLAGHLERRRATRYAYQWQRDSGSGFTDIAGATGTTYALGVADVGTRIRVRVTATNPDASVSATSIGSSVVQAGAAGQHGRADDLRHRAAHLHADLDAGHLERDRQRLHLPVAAPHDRGRSRTSPARPARRTRSARRTSARRSGCASPRRTPTATLSAVSAATAVVAAAPPRNTGLPSVSGPAKLERHADGHARRLDARPTSTSPTRGSATASDIAGATGATYTLQPADVGKQRAGQGHRDQRRRQRERDLRRDGAGRRAAREHGGARARRPERRGRRPRSRPPPARWDTPGASFTYTWLRCAADATASRELRGGRHGQHVHALGRRRRPSLRRPRHRHLQRRDDHGRQRADRHGRPADAAQTSRRPSIAGNAYVGETLSGRRGPLDVPVARRHVRLAALRRGRPQLHVGRRRLAAVHADRATTSTTRSCSSSPRRRPGRARPRSSAPLAIQARPGPALRRRPDRDAAPRSAAARCRPAPGRGPTTPAASATSGCAATARAARRSPARPATATCSPRPTSASPSPSS